MKRILPFLASTILLLQPMVLPAQTGGYDVTLLPRFGVLTQLSPFGYPWNDPPPEFRQVWRYRARPAESWGGALELARVDLPFRLRLEFTRVGSTEIRQKPGDHGPPIWERAEVSLGTVTAAAVIQPAATCYGSLCPRLLLGSGAKRYRFDADVLSDDMIYPLAQDQTRLTLQLGAGMVMGRGPVSLVVEANDYTSRARLFWSDDPGGRVHDLVTSVGLALRLPS